MELRGFSQVPVSIKRGTRRGRTRGEGVERKGRGEKREEKWMDEPPFRNLAYAAAGSRCFLNIPLVNILPLASNVAIVTVRRLLCRITGHNITTQQRRGCRLSTVLVGNHARKQPRLGRDAGVFAAPWRLPPASRPAQTPHPSTTVLAHGVGEDQRQDDDAGRDADDQADVHPQRRGKSGSVVVLDAVLLRLDFVTRLIQLVEEDRSFPGWQLDSD